MDTCQPHSEKIQPTLHWQSHSDFRKHAKPLGISGVFTALYTGKKIALFRNIGSRTGGDYHYQGDRSSHQRASVSNPCNVDYVELQHLHIQGGKPQTPETSDVPLRAERIPGLLPCEQGMDVSVVSSSTANDISKYKMYKMENAC